KVRAERPEAPLQTPAHVLVEIVPDNDVASVALAIHVRAADVRVVNMVSFHDPAPAPAHRQASVFAIRWIRRCDSAIDKTVPDEWGLAVALRREGNIVRASGAQGGARAGVAGAGRMNHASLNPAVCNFRNA